MKEVWKNISKAMDTVLEKALIGILAIVFVFGILQALVIVTSTLFGVIYTPYQYGASAIMLVFGLCCVKMLLNYYQSMEE